MLISLTDVLLYFLETWINNFVSRLQCKDDVYQWNNTAVNIRDREKKIGDSDCTS